MVVFNILNFKNDYPALKVFKLEQNYRSTKTIVEAANKLIKHNKNQIEKTIDFPLPAGVYFLKIMSVGHEETLKLLKM